MVRSTAPDSNRGATTVLLAIPQTETVNAGSLQPVKAVRTAVRNNPGVIGVAGDGAIELDYQHAVFGNFPLMFAVIALLTIALLTRAFRSVVLAVKAVLMNLISMAAAFGVITWFWQQGHGSSFVFGIPATGAVTFWIPLMVFAFLFGLSMDYEVFILSRVREEYDRTGSTDAAIIEGLGAHRAPGDQRRADPVPVLRVAGLSPQHRCQGAGHRPGRRNPARRHNRPRAPRTRTGVAVRTVELVVPAARGAQCCASRRPPARRWRPRGGSRRRDHRPAARVGPARGR